MHSTYDTNSEASIPPPGDAYTQRRNQMVQMQLAERGIHDESVLDAMRAVPRHRFVSPDMVEFAYEDRAMPVGCEQTISQPYIVALMSSMLHIQPTDRVLEIGTGTGYQTAILARLACTVYSIERIEALAAAAKARLAELKFDNVHLRVGDGSLGWPEAAPFDGIMVTAGAPKLVDNLVKQLAVGGRLVIPTGPEDRQRLTTVIRYHDRIVEKPGIPVRFVRLVGASAYPG